jgi:hypothetical protein
MEELIYQVQPLIKKTDERLAGWQRPLAKRRLIKVSSQTKATSMTSLPDLPASYRNFLKQHDGETSYTIDDIHGWRFYKLEELTKLIRINREKVLTIHQLKAYVNAIREFHGDETEDQDGEPYALDRLAAGLAIGDNNGDVVFLDTEDGYSIWVWHHDGADVEKMADSFEQWLESATPDTDDYDNDSED